MKVFLPKSLNDELVITNPVPKKIVKIDDLIIEDKNNNSKSTSLKSFSKNTI